MSRCRFPWTIIAALTLAIIFSFGSGRVFAASPHEQVLWSFGGPGDGSDPEAGLLQVGGKLYGTTRAGGANGAPGPLAGVVFQLAPPAQGQKAWSESVLWSFANFPYGNGVAGDGSEPIGGLISAGGKLFGTTFWVAQARLGLRSS